MRRLILASAFMFAAVPVFAGGWSLAPDASSLGFVTIKNGDTAEAHSIDGLSGIVEDSGAATISVPLLNVETYIDIRNERMRKILFAASPKATVTANIDLDALSDLAPGSRRTQELEVKLTANGTEVDYFTDVTITRVSDDAVSVSTTRPLITDARDLGFDGGVEELRQLAGLDSISPAVPVNFDLMFTR